MRSIPMLLALLLCAPAALAQVTADEVIAKHLTARGGENWQNVKTLSMSGSYMGFSIPKPFSLTRAWPNKVRFDHWVGENWTPFGGVDTNLWWQSPMYGMTKPGPIQGRDLNHMLPETDFLTPFFNYKERGYKVRYDGIQEIEGVTGHALVLTRGEGHEETWIIDQETYLEGARTAPASDFGRPFVQYTFFDDFRAVEGMQFPFVVETTWHTRRRLMEVREVKLNVDVEDGLFEMPQPDFISKLRFMLGDWTVDAGIIPEPNAPYQRSKATSSIKLEGEGLMFLETANLPTIFGPGEGMNTISYDASKARYVMTRYSTGIGYTLVYHGKAEGDGIVFESLPTDSSWSPRRGLNLYEKIVIKPQGDGFVIDVQLTQNKGESWMDYLNLIYSKAK